MDNLNYNDEILRPLTKWGNPGGYQMSLQDKINVWVTGPAVISTSFTPRGKQLIIESLDREFKDW